MTMDCLPHQVHLVHEHPIPAVLLRLGRLLRIVRVLRTYKRMRDLILTIALMLPSILNVGLLLSILMYVYAILGRQLFAFLAGPEAGGGVNGGITEERNFQTFGSSLLVVFQVLTEDGWSKIMADAMLVEENGECVQALGNCGTLAAIPFFISFHLIGSYVLLNLVVASMLEVYSRLHRMSRSLFSELDLELFNRAWAILDPDATSFIFATEVPELLRLLGNKVPIAMPPVANPEGEGTLPSTALPAVPFQLLQYNGMVTYQDVMVELVEHNYFKVNSELVDEAALRKVADSGFRRPLEPDEFPSPRSIERRRRHNERRKRRAPEARVSRLTALSVFMRGLRDRRLTGMPRGAPDSAPHSAHDSAPAASAAPAAAGTPPSANAVVHTAAPVAAPTPMFEEL